MKNTPKTIIFFVIAVVLCAVAVFTAPQQASDSLFDDLGAEFYPAFKDALNASELEVIGVDKVTNELIPFKVALKDGRWSLPSYSGYPADAKDKMAHTAARLLNLKREVLRSSLSNDHEALEVIDPKEKATIGNGTRVTLRDKSGVVLCDYIFGKEVEGKRGYRYVRIPGQPKTFETKVDLEVSTKFSDWVETGLLEMSSSDAAKLNSFDYSVTQGRRVPKGKYELKKDANNWTATVIPTGKELDQAAISAVVDEFTKLKLAGVRSKPESLVALLNGKGEGLTPQSQASLQGKGFYLIQSGGIVGDEGEFIITKSNGVAYIIYFGVSFKDDSIKISSSKDEKEATEDSGRYMFISTVYDATQNVEPKRLTEPAKLAEKASEEDKKKHQEAQNNYNKSIADHEAWGKTKKEAMEEVEKLKKRFNNWYYVISNESYQKVKVKFESFLKVADAPKKDAPKLPAGLPPGFQLPQLPK